MSATLAHRYQKQLSEWLGGNKCFELLYNATRDGCGAIAFHSKCDNKGSTIAILQNVTGHLFGGYTLMNWNCKTGYTYDDKAFLFRLEEERSFNPKMYKIQRVSAQNATNNSSSYGPIFGKNEFIVTGAGPFVKSGGFFLCEFKMKPGGTYDLRGDSVQDLTGNNSQIVEIEVYAVKDKETDFDEPWRKVGLSDIEKLTTEVEEYCPLEEVKLDNVNILLVGAVGSGKSSYFNTINSIFRGHVAGQARTGSAATSLTTLFMAYKVRSKSGGAMKFRLCDSRGLEVEKGLRAEDLVAMVDGHIENGYQFNPFAKADANTSGYRKNPTFGDTMHCVAFVVDASTVDVYSDKLLQTIKEFQQTLNHRGVPQVILLTKVDKVCPVLDKDLSILYSSVAVAELVDTVAQMLGLPRSCVLPVKNYEKETELDPSVDVPALISLRQMLRSVDDYLYYHLDRQEP